MTANQFTLTLDRNTYALRQGPADPYSSGTFKVMNQADSNWHVDFCRTFLKGSPALNQSAIDNDMGLPFGDETGVLQTNYGLVKLEDNRLTVCWHSEKRPSPYSTVNESGRLLMIFDRVSSKPLTTAELKAIRLQGQE